MAAEEVYPGKKFLDYALLGDDIVIGDPSVAEVYKRLINELGVQISPVKSLSSDTGCFEFAKKFVTPEGDLSPVSVKAIRSAGYTIRIFHVMRQYGLSSLSLSMRLRGAGYRRYNIRPPFLNLRHRHWCRHVISFYSPMGACPLPFLIWLGFPDNIPVNCYHLGMVRQTLIDLLEVKDLNRLEKVLSSLTDDERLLVELTNLGEWMKSYVDYVVWVARISVSEDWCWDELLSPPLINFSPYRTWQTEKCYRYGKLFKCYDLIRRVRAPLPLAP